MPSHVASLYPRATTGRSKTSCVHHHARTALTLPLDEVLQPNRCLATANNALDDLAPLKPLIPALLLDLIRLQFLAGQTLRKDALLKAPDLLDVVVDALHALVALEELVGLVGVVQMGEVLPFDVEALEEKDVQ